LANLVRSKPQRFVFAVETLEDFLAEAEGLKAENEVVLAFSLPSSCLGRR
jgi:hypothetical protein